MWVLPTKNTFILVTKRLLTWLWVNLTRNHVTKRHLNPQPLGLSIFSLVRFWIKINNQTNFILFLVLEPNQTENRFKPINFGSVRFDFFPFQTGLNRNFYTCFHFPKNQFQFSFCSPCPEVNPSKKIHKTKGFDCKKTKRKSKVIEM